MTYSSKEEIMSRLQEHYDRASEEGELFGVFLQGSQNYIDDLFFKGSDVDSRAVYIPDTKHFCLGNDTSKPVIALNNDEHVDRFDVRKFFKLLKKPGINNYEALFTEYYIINDKYKNSYGNLTEIRERIVRSNPGKFLMATMCVSKKDLKNLEKRIGGEDSDIDKYGYSRKRLSNIMRLNETVKAYIDGAEFGNCLKAMNEQMIHSVRRTELFNLEEALDIAEKCDRETLILAKLPQGLDADESVLSELDDILVELLSTRFKL